MKSLSLIKTILALIFVGAVYLADVSLIVFQREYVCVSGDATGFVLTCPSDYGGNLLDLNQATAEQLMQLPNIGEVRAAVIIAYRESSGGFLTVEELAEVKGFSRNLMKKLRPYITVTEKS